MMEYCLNETDNNFTKCDMDFILNPFDNVQITAFSGVYILLSLASLFLNGILTYIILNRDYMRTNPNFLVANLMITNLILAAFWIPLLWRPSYENEFDNSMFFCKLSHSFPSINVCVTLFTVFGVVLYYVLDKRHSFRLQLRWSLLLIVVVWAFSLVANSINLAYYTIREFKLPANYTVETNITEIPSPNATVLAKLCTFYPPSCDTYGYLSRSCFEDRIYYNVVNNSILTAVLYVIPIIVLFLMVFDTYIRPLMSDSSSDPDNETLDKERKVTTREMIAIALIYGLWWLPRICATFYFQFHRLESSDLKYLKVIDELCSITVLLSTCVTPVVFGFGDDIFQAETRHVLGELFLCLPRHPRRNDLRDSFRIPNLTSSQPLLTNEENV